MNSQDMQYKPMELRDLLECAGYAVPDHIVMSTINVKYPNGNIGGDMQVQEFTAERDGVEVTAIPYEPAKGNTRLIRTLEVKGATLDDVLIELGLKNNKPK